MTTIVIAHPTARYPEYSVFGVYVGADDRYVFAVRAFPPGDRDAAEAYARRLMARHEADHLERTTNGPPDAAPPAAQPPSRPAESSGPGE